MATDVTDTESALECISEHLALSLERKAESPDLNIPPDSKLQRTLVMPFSSCAVRPKLQPAADITTQVQREPRFVQYSESHGSGEHDRVLCSGFYRNKGER